MNLVTNLIIINGLQLAAVRWHRCLL